MGIGEPFAQPTSAIDQPNYNNNKEFTQLYNSSGTLLDPQAAQSYMQGQISQNSQDVLKGVQNYNQQASPNNYRTNPF